VSELVRSRFRRQGTTLAIGVSLFLASLPALPTNDMRPLTVLVLSQMCIAQDPEFREGVYGRSLASRPYFQGWETFDRQPLVQCLRKRQWVPKSLCASVNALDPDDPKEFEAWWQDNENTLQTLEPVFDFYGQVLDDSNLATSCPSIALQSKTPPRPPDITIERVDLIWAGEYKGEVSPVPRVTLVQGTDHIAAAIGVHFGIYFNIVSNPAEGILTVLYKISVPEPGLPGRAASARQRVLTDRPQCILGGPCVVGFVFEREDEIIPGEWLLEVSFRGKTLIEHRFTVYRKVPMARNSVPN
jgi:hypothetical protein